METVLITGSSKGLGKCLALMFAQNGYNIIVHGRDERALAELKDTIAGKGVRCDIVAGDITSKETVRELAEISEKRNLKILINNAGIYCKKPFPEMALEDFRNVMEVNLFAPIYLTHALFSIFRKKRSGVIVNINSIAGKNSSDGESAYCTSKHGLRGFTGSLQFDATKNGIRVIDVYLGAMDTAMIEGRKDPEKCISPSEAAQFVFNVCKEYRSMRVNEVELNRRLY